MPFVIVAFLHSPLRPIAVTSFDQRAISVIAAAAHR
jgi:hypothetical protein